MHEQEDTMNKGTKYTINLRRFTNNSQECGGSLIAAGEWLKKKTAEDEEFYVLRIIAHEYRTDIFYEKRKNR